MSLARNLAVTAVFALVACGQGKISETATASTTSGGTSGPSSATAGTSSMTGTGTGTTGNSSGHASTGATSGSSSGAFTSSSGMSGLHVANGEIENGAGELVQLHGVDRSGTEYACIQGWGIFDGPNDQASIAAMLTWHANAVRVPLNEDCWLNINGVEDGGYGGAAYQSAIQDFVSLITSSGMAVILDLHWAAPGTEPATGQLPMADADHTPTFWGQVATTFAGNSAVIFDLFNEPYITDWSCWTSGGSCAQDDQGNSYDTPGMAGLLQAVRGAGAQNVVILGGLGYSSDFSQWVTSVQSFSSLAAPLDGLSTTNVAASWHSYDFNSGNSGCPSQYNGYTGMCNSGEATAAAASIPSVLSAGFPVVMGESGISAYDTASAAAFTASQLTDIEDWYDSELTYMEQQNQGYLAWDWNTDGDPYLLTAYTGTPTPYFGQTYQAHLAGL